MQTERLCVPAIRIEQNGKVFYVTAVPASRLLEISKVDVWHSGATEPGYQRAPEARRKNKIAEYVSRTDEMLPIGGLLNARRVDEDSSSEPILRFEPESKMAE